MIKYKFGEVVLIIFPQLNGDKKKRPAFVILDTDDDDIVLAPVTTTERRGKGDYKIKNWQESGLLLESWVRLAKIACLEKNDIERILGNTTTYDKRKVVSIWKEAYKFNF